MLQRMASRGVVAVIAVGLLTFSVDSVAAKKKKPAAEAAPSGDLAAFLVKPAEEAMKKRDYALAVSLYSGIVAIRGTGDEAMWKLAEAWEIAGEFESAAEELQRYADTVTDATLKQKAQDKIAELGRREGGFGSGKFTPKTAKKEAAIAFKKGRDFFKKKKYAEAVLMFRAGIEMAPNMAGNYRELGQAYEKLGRGAEANDFFVRYLRMHPFGKNADEVRKQLAKAKLLGKVSIESSFPCEQVWVNGQPMEAKMKLPVKELTMAPGKYKALCYSEQFHLAHYERFEVVAGGSAKLVFAWAILENKLDPWGRIVLENPRKKGEMIDIGLFPEIGVPIPDDKRALDVVLTAGDGSKKVKRTLRLDAGKRHAIKWE